MQKTPCSRDMYSRPELLGLAHLFRPPLLTPLPPWFSGTCDFWPGFSGAVMLAVFTTWPCYFHNSLLIAADQLKCRSTEMQHTQGEPFRASLARPETVQCVTQRTQALHVTCICTCEENVHITQRGEHGATSIQHSELALPCWCHHQQGRQWEVPGLNRDKS